MNITETPRFLTSKICSRTFLEHILEVKKRGVSVIFITHNIYHVYEVADRLVLLEKGEKIGDYNKEDITPEKVMDIIAAAAGVAK